MSALERALVLAGTAAQYEEQKLNKQLDKKEGELALQKKFNEAIDTLERKRSDGNFTVEDKEAVIAAAKKAGVTLTTGAESDFGAFHQVHVVEYGEWKGNAHLEAADEDATWDTDRRNCLDDVAKKLERELRTAQDSTGQTDLKLNLALNRLSQKLQDANNTIATIKELERGLTPGG